MSETVHLKISVSGGGAAIDSTNKLDMGMVNLASAFYLAEQAMSAFSSVMEQTVGVAAELEEQLAVMGAIVGETTDNFNEFTESMREHATLMSVKYPVAASEVAKGLIGIAQAGFEAEDAMFMADHILALATATNADFADAAAVTVTSMRAMGLEVEDTERLVNIFQFAVNRSRNNMQDLAQSLKFVTGFANTLGIELESLTAAQMTLVNAGLEAGIAGRTLQTMLMDIASPTNQARDAISRLGLEFWDAEGYMKDMVGISEELERVFGTTKLSGEALSDMTMIFGQRSMRAVAILRENADVMREFEEQMKNGTVVAATQAEFAMMSLTAMIMKFKNMMMLPFLQESFLAPLKNLLIVNIDKFKELSYVLAESLGQVMMALIPLFEIVLDMVMRNQSGFELWTQIIVIQAQALVLLVRIFNIFGGQGIKILTLIYLLSKAYQIMTAQIWLNIGAMILKAKVTYYATKADLVQKGVMDAGTLSMMQRVTVINAMIGANVGLATSMILVGGVMVGAILAFVFWDDITTRFGKTTVVVIGVLIALAAAITAVKYASTGLGAVAAATATFVGLGLLMDEAGVGKEKWETEGPSVEDIEKFNKRLVESELEVAALEERNKDLLTIERSVDYNIQTQYIGDDGGAKKYAKGFHGYVTEPTPIIVGEAGPERVDITPRHEWSDQMFMPQRNTAQQSYAEPLNTPIPDEAKGFYGFERPTRSTIPTEEPESVRPSRSAEIDIGMDEGQGRDVTIINNTFNVLDSDDGSITRNVKRQAYAARGFLPY